MVKFLLSRRANVAACTDGFDNTALPWAAKLNLDNSHKDIIRMLMEHRSDPNHKNVKSLTPFNYIVQLGDLDLVTFFIDEHKADLKKLKPDKSNALAFAAQNEHEQVMDLVLKNEVNINQSCKYQLITLLHHASSVSLLKNVQRLISEGAEVNAEDWREYTPIFNCIIELHVLLAVLPLVFFRVDFGEERKQVIRLLLESGSDVNHNPTFEQTKMTILEYFLS
ncbi:homeobox protein Wariai-like [Nasonia vitripennis]|uniref:Uncharacterized protein n=1 Tax=Nasonia vitripennis TaxID=7425 RepID=A0A7M7M7S0_NASVI|nr:homeobox protein Wariai-like [Nasonia vitripennis]